ncbi:MAG: ImmA/IrrE family metallo-endopeptidase [Chloroflexi bacterium]|nr:ImmA/IrrE family metallo-endopeptidase [Chloroflexota bacterium]
MREHVLDNVDPRVLGERLQEVRKTRGLTQEDVARELGIARTSITAVEKGERRVQAGELIKLARLYGRQVNELLGQRRTFGNFAVQFRTAVARSGQPQAPAEQAIEEFQKLCEDYLYLEKLCGSSLPHDYPREYGLNGLPPEDAAEDIASAERNRLSLGDGPVLNLRELLENDVGLRIFYPRLPSQIAGMFTFGDVLGGCIAVNSVHPEERRRWSLAHEYGHFLANRYRSEVFVTLAHERIPASERFGSAFAGAFLMPGPGLKRRFNELARWRKGGATVADLCRLAHYYFVSVEALTRRLEGLGLLPIGKWDTLSERGFKVREAQEILQLPPHPAADNLLPTRYQYLAMEAYQKGNLSEGQLARLMRTDRVGVRRLMQSLSCQPHVSRDGDLVSLTPNLSQPLGKLPRAKG